MIKNKNSTNKSFAASRTKAMPRLSVANVTKRFQDSYNKKEFISAVDDVSFGFEAGRIYGLIGQNGAGKSTLLKTMAGVLKADSGKEKLILGNKPDSLKSNSNDTLLTENATIDLWNNEYELLSNLRYCPQKPVFYPLLTVEENLMLMGRLYNLTEGQLKLTVERLTSKFKLAEKKGTLAKNLSGGQKQRLNLIISLLIPSIIYLFDEPTTGLDLQGKRLFAEMLNALKSEGKIIIISTHDFSEAEGLCDYIIFMNRGKIIADGTLKELMLNSSEWDSIYTITLEQFKSGIDLDGLINGLREEFGGLISRVTVKETDNADKNRSGIRACISLLLCNSSNDVSDIKSEQDLIFRVNRAIQQKGWDIIEMILKKKALKDVYEELINLVS